ncbi:MAG: hypothetical protein M3O91_08835 [Chloroflexota bacterium]|nr:hypothetical protein [Chloroflexota bacterium]
MTLLLGVLMFIAVTIFEQLPVLGWLGWAVSLAAWMKLPGFDVSAIVQGFSQFSGDVAKDTRYTNTSVEALASIHIIQTYSGWVP